MKKCSLLLAGLALSLGLAAGLKATDISVAAVTLTAATGAQLFATGTSAPLTYNSSTVAGPGISIKRVVFGPNSQTYTGQTTTQLWDTPDGRTSTAGARPLTPPINQLIPSADKPYIWDFTLNDGSDRAGGVYCKGFPVLIETGSNTVNGQLHYIKGVGNPVMPGSTAGLVAH